MTDEQINAKIAEITKLYEDTHYPDIKRIPDFCNDLNAMHKAEKHHAINFHDYGIHLYQIVVPQETRIFVKDDPKGYIWHATAIQRAQAFLRTLGKWKEGNG